MSGYECAHENDCFDFPERYVGHAGDLAAHDADWPCCDVRDPHWHVIGGVGVEYDPNEVAS